MRLCIDCRHRERGLYLTPLCKRPNAYPAAELVCAKERYSRDAGACGQIGKFIEPMEPA